jgi:mono/diheme cytochrome c family protein
MNNEFKYGMQGLVMAIGFFAALKISLIIIQISPVPQKEKEADSPTTSVESTVSVNAEGKRLFSQNCASCHAIHKQLTGPALAGIEERVPDRNQLYEWVRNSESVIKSGEPYFVDLYNRFNKTSMNQFPNLTNADIDNILDYIKE